MPLLCEHRGAVAVLTLSRPEARNAWCEEFQTGLVQRLPELEADPDIRCVILTGDDKGGAFSAGADLKNPRTHTMDSVAAFIEGPAEPPARASDPDADRLRQADHRRGERLRRRHRLHRHLLLRHDRRLGARGVAAAAERSRHHPGAGRCDAAGALGRQGPGDARRVRLPAEGGGGVSHRPRAMAGAARRTDGARDGGGRAHRLAAAAGDAADQGVAEPRHRRAAGGRGAGRSVSLRHAGDDRGQAGSAPGLARTPEAEDSRDADPNAATEAPCRNQSAPSSSIRRTATS